MQEFRVVVDAPAKKSDKPGTHILTGGSPAPPSATVTYLVDAEDETEASQKAIDRYASGEGL